MRGYAALVFAAIILFSGGFLWFALYEVAFGLCLAATFWRAFQVKIVANP